MSIHLVRKSKSGQVTIFVALIFQILFLFFAIVINVGLLVHHKVNLQNSVDLAAYYGAMKQAQTMNAIAHTNYQIRQSWKLLTWRYRILGSAGDFKEHPFNKETGRLQNGDEDGINPSQLDFYEAPSFCITYIPFREMPRGENTCKDLRELSGIKVFEVPRVFIDLPNFSHSVRNISEQLRAKVFERCKIFGAFNYLALGRFVASFNIDQGQRMLLISQLSYAISPEDPTSDFYDIEGQSVHQGIEATLKNNLTNPNRDSVTFEVYNSLGHNNCNKSSVASGAPAKWLRPIKIAPGFVYVDTLCEPGTNRIQPVSKELSKDIHGWPNYSKSPDGYYHNDIKEMSPWIKMAEPPIDHPFNFSLGVEKSPWCMAYVGVSAQSKPEIPFSPMGRITLKARAFYKPFGGRIGPWYYDKWPSRDVPGVGSGPGNKLDPNLPPRVTDPSNIGEPKDPTRVANYSRFLGDQWGLKSRRVLFQYGRAIYSLDSQWASKINLPKVEDDSGDLSDDAPRYSHWDHLPYKFFEKGGSQDIMAWDLKNDQPSRMRELETAAILPDTFDFAYYSIEPDFYHNYYVRIRDGFLKTIGSDYYSKGREFLGDLGTHKGAKVNGINYDEFSVKDQYTVVGRSVHLNQFLEKDKLTYMSLKWEHALTGWAPTSLMNYELSNGKFGKCAKYPFANAATSGNCVVGGSTGYSVKMVSSDFLRGEIPNIGGMGVHGQILNPPPPEEEF
ncbi:Tad domain-containing protein [Bdellovibrio bacteriovorus]|uniref:Tad domain-containing protein n=1 Tax=Bdellovibrio TaxID=958 RepID=UPI0035A8D8C8